MFSDQAINSICQKLRITDYLNSKGVDIKKAGKRWKCVCPLPDHKDTDPSFYIRELPDGTQLFKCFGCGQGGSIITLVSIIEKIKKGHAVNKLSKVANVSLGKFDDAIRTDPLPSEIMEFFCEEDDLVMEIACMALEFMRAHKTDDVINKVSRLYKILDEMAEKGDEKGIHDIYSKMSETISSYM